MTAIFGVALLLMLPVTAMLGIPKPFSWIALGWTGIISLAAVVANVRDKHKAQSSEWRTPEATLHFLELLGGWPGAFVAQRIWRHKTSKGSYQGVFWLIVVVHQVVSLHYLKLL
jgi:uncharacterized membrane protein YsdA (DUF1294 family)